MADDTQLKTCPVCECTPVKAWWADARKEVDCPACGRFAIYIELNIWLWKQRDAGLLTSQQKDTLSRLSTAIRHSASPPYIRFENWEQLANEVPRFSMAVKLRRLLEACGRLARPGQRFQIDNAVVPRLVPEIAATNTDEVVLLMNHLIARRHLEGAFNSSGFRGGLVTVQGWETLEPLGGGIPGRVFVAMWFDASMDDAYSNGFSPAIEDCGLEPRRIDHLDFASKICDRILAEVRAAQIVVADFTGFRSGVFFEAGFALGLGRMVIFSCRQDAVDDLSKHFDTRQYPHILWNHPADLRAKLADRIRALNSVPIGI